jgi:hypothetical protein
MVSPSPARTPKSSASTRRPRAHTQGSANRGSGADHEQSVPNDEPHRRGARGAERQPNADLLRALRDNKRHHTVEANDGEQEGYRSEPARQCRQQLLRSQRLINLVLERRERDDGQRRGDPRHRPANRRKRGIPDGLARDLLQPLCDGRSREPPRSVTSALPAPSPRAATCVAARRCRCR